MCMFYGKLAMLINFKSQIVLSLVFFISACVSSDNYVSAVQKQDTFETYNRAMTTFNTKVYKYVLKPAVKGYQKVTTPEIRLHISSAFDNTREPFSAVNHTLQADIKRAGIDILRFAVNTTLGLGGFFDVASAWGLSKKQTDFDQTLAVWCVADGPYLVLPVVGPSTVRGTSSYVSEYVNPTYYFNNDANVKYKILAAYAATDALVTFDKTQPILDDLEKNSIDYYSSMRAMYLQNHEKINKMCKRISNNSVNSYDFDFEEDYE